MAAHRCLAVGSLDGRVALEAQRLGVQAELANLHQDAPAAPANRRQDVRRSDDRTQDLPEAVVQTLDQLGGKAQLVARFPVEVESEGLRNQEVLGVLDRDVRRCRREDLDRDVPVDQEVPDRAAPVVPAKCCQDVRRYPIHRMEGRCNTRFLF